MTLRSLYTQYRLSLSLIAIVGLVVAIYLPGLQGPFVFDDDYHIVSNPAIALENVDFASLRHAAMTNNSGPLKRPLAMASLALNHYFAGGTANTFPFKTTNLIIHLINTGLVYWFSLLLARQLSARPDYNNGRLLDWLPTLTAAIWALHPLQLTSVLYTVQRMTSLSALFVLAGLIIFIHGRSRIDKGRRLGYVLMTTGLVGGLVLGLASKENAALLLLYVLIIELIFFRGTINSKRTAHRLKWFYGIGVFGPCLFALCWLLVNPELVSQTYAWREFGIYERLLTEPRILWFYISLLMLPGPHRLALFHDDIVLSTGLFEPWTTAVALGGLLLVATLGLVFLRKYPVLGFSILWFLAGHAMESSIIGLELAHEHRNYISMLGPVFGIAYGLLCLLGRLRTPTIPVVTCMLVSATLAFSTYTRAQIWGNKHDIAMHLIRHHPDSPRTHTMAAQIHLQNRNPAGAISHYQRASQLAPEETGYLLRLAAVVASSAIIKSNMGTTTEANPARIGPYMSIMRIGDGLRLRLTPRAIAEITQKLRDNLVTGKTARGLAEIAECAVSNKELCGYLYPQIAEWYQIAIYNPRVVSGVRSDMIITLAKTHLAYGERLSALRVARNARTLDPMNPNFILMEADLFFRVGQLAESEQALSILDTPGINATTQDREQADILYALIESQRNQGLEKQ